MDLIDLKLQQTYTIAYFSAFGLPTSTVLRLRNIDQKQQVTSLYGIAKDKRRTVCYIMHKSRQFIIWDGEVAPNVNIVVASYLVHKQKATLRQLQRWPDYDARYMHRALTSVEKKPLIVNIEPMPKGRVKLIDLCFESTP